MTNNLRKIFDDIEVKERKEKGLVCKGLFFRGYSSIYYSGGKLEKKEGLRLLKRKSCDSHNCGSDNENSPQIHCYHWMLDEMTEMLNCEGVIIPNIEDGALYGIRVTNETHDWDSGYCDGYDFEFYRIKEDDKKD